MAFLVKHQHGKSKVRLARVWKEGEKHFFVEFNVGVSLKSDMEHAFLSDSNRDMTATDTVKNNVCPFCCVLAPCARLRIACRIPALLHVTMAFVSSGTCFAPCAVLLHRETDEQKGYYRGIRRDARGALLQVVPAGGLTLMPAFSQLDVAFLCNWPVPFRCMPARWWSSKSRGRESRWVAKHTTTVSSQWRQWEAGLITHHLKL